MSEWIHVNHPTAEPPKCDFCSTQAVTVCFVSVDAGIGMTGDEPIELVPGEQKVRNLILSSDAHWAACEPCAAIIRTGDHAALRERSYQHAPREIKESETGAITLRLIQETMFWAGFQGAEHPASEHPVGGAG